MTLSSDCGSYTKLSEILNSKQNYPYYCCRHCHPQQQFAYRFLEFNPNDKQKAYPWMTDRIITASSGDCIQFEEINSTETQVSRHYNFGNGDGSYNGSIEIPYALEIPGATTYIYRGIREPQYAEQQRCGKRCMWMWAHKNIGKGANSTFFQCPITISDVTNTHDETQQVPDDVALLAAASIGVNGRQNADGSWTQFQFNPFGFVLAFS